MRILMVGVDEQTKGGMWAVAANYLRAEDFVRQTGLEYVSTSITGSIPQRLLFTAKALLKILFRLLVGKFDIVHVHMSERGSVYRKNIVISMAQLFRCKVVIHMHGAEFESWYSSLSAYGKKSVRRILNKADRVLILGHYWKDFIGNLLNQKEKIRVLHNAVYVPEENLYSGNAVNMLFLGVAGRRKGILDLLQALKQADAQLPPNVKLMIYGPQKDISVENEIQKLGISHRAVYKGWLTAEQKAEVFGQTALNILPSYHEGLPMTILETMAYGIPNISTNVAAIPEVVDDTNGILITPGDTQVLTQEIVRLMNENHLRAEKSRCAYDLTKREFSIEAHLAKVLQVYRELDTRI